MDGLLAQAKSTGQDMEKEKTGMEALGSLIQLVQKAKQNDTEGASKALVDLSKDVAKLSALQNNGTEHHKSGSHHHGTNSEHHWDQVQSQLFTNDTDPIDYGNETMSWKDGLPDKVREYLESANNGSYTNSTDDGNNSTDSWGDLGGFADLGHHGHKNASDDMSTGLSFDEIGTPTDLNATYTHSTAPTIFACLVMITFFYYVPRMLYHRATNISSDAKHSSFVPIMYLSLIALTGAGIHLANAYYHATHNMVANLLSGDFSFDAPDLFVPMVYRALVASINRIVSPIVALLCLQQISTHSKYNSLQIFQNSIVMTIYCIACTVVVFAYSFYREYDFMISVEDTFVYPDQIHADFIDIIPPLITAFLFFFAKHTIARQDLYTAEKYGPNGPTTLDRVSKVAVFQLVMVFFAIGATFWSPSRDEEKHLASEVFTWYYFFITAQTPFVHFVLFKSLLRSRKSTRICFLVCCYSGEKVATADNGVEMNQNPRTTEPSEKEEEDGEANTMETLDHNKIHIIPDVGALQEKA